MAELRPLWRLPRTGTLSLGMHPLFGVVAMCQPAWTTCHFVSSKELLQMAGLQSSQSKLARPGRLDVVPPWLTQSAGLLYPWLHFQRYLRAFAGYSQAMRSLQKYTTSILSTFRDLSPVWLNTYILVAPSLPYCCLTITSTFPVPAACTHPWDLLFTSLWRQGDLLCPLYST